MQSAKRKLLPYKNQFIKFIHLPNLLIRFLLQERRLVDANYNRLRTPVRLEDNQVLKIPVVESRIEVEFDHYRVEINTQTFYGNQR